MPNLTPVICLVGTTATGKTELALALAKWWLTESPLANEISGVDILSADSRQIYQGLEIISGADIPPDFTLINFASESRPKQIGPLDLSVKTALQSHWEMSLSVNEYDSKVISLWGLSCLPPHLTWSAGQFRTFGQTIVAGAALKNRALIVVGGTGLYQQVLWQKDWQPDIKPDLTLRLELESATLTDLQGLLKTKNPEAFSKLNNSDLANPRRLIRQLELVNSNARGMDTSDSVVKETPVAQKIITFGLNRSLKDLPNIIEARVLKRLEMGAKNEVSLLDLSTAVPNAISTLGVKELMMLDSENAKLDEVIHLWVTRELQYAKRQITWWKKRPNIIWFDAADPSLVTRVTAEIKTKI